MKRKTNAVKIKSSNFFVESNKSVLKQDKTLHSVGVCKLDLKPSNVKSTELLQEGTEDLKNLMLDQKQKLSIDLNKPQQKRIKQKVIINGTAYYKKNKNKKLKSYANESLSSTDIALLKKAQKVRYKPPLSYRWLKLFGMLALVVPFLMLRILLSSENADVYFFDVVVTVADTISLPLVLLAAFVLILRRDKDIKSVMLIYFAIVAVIYVLIVFLFERYAITYFSVTNPELTPEQVRALANDKISHLGIANYNLFVDLFLCSVFYFFTNFTPKSIEKSKAKMVLFRLGALIPLAYVVMSIILLGLFHQNTIALDVEFISLLTCRAPATYIVFFGLCIYLSFSKSRFLKKGSTSQGLIIYKKTGAHALEFDVACSFFLAFASLVDYLLSLIPALQIYGFGESCFMFTIIPFIMLISYTKTHKNTLIDIFVPIAGVCIIVFLVADMLFTALVG